MYITPTPIGERSKRITLRKRNVNVTNELGETVPSHTPAMKLWAKIRPLSSKEMIANAQNNLNVTHEIRVPYVNDISHADSFEYQGRYFDIESVIDLLEQHIELKLMCNEVQ